MKCIVLFLMAACSCLTIAAQEPAAESGAEVVVRAADRYKLYPTSDSFYFLKLDTRTGAIAQIEWSFRVKSCRETRVSAAPVPLSEEAPNGRFELYPTQNVFAFLLQDKVGGETWLLQWNANSSKKRLDKITR